MASSVDIVPSLGQAVTFLQEGPGISPGYGAIDRRRMLVASGVREGIVHENAYRGSAAGTGMTVVAAADQGMVNIQGDSVPYQGVYVVAPHSAAITLDIAAAHATLPRNDLVILEVLDDDRDSGGLNKARVRVITGTATSGAVRTDAFGVHGTPTPGNSQFPLFVVNVPALDTVIDSTQVDDRRLRTTGKAVIAGAETLTSSTYASMPTPDSVRNVVMPTDGLIHIAYQAMWKESVTNAASAALYIGSNQLKARAFAGSWPAVIGAAAASIGNANILNPLWSFGGGLQSANQTSAGSTPDANPDVTTGQIIGGTDYAGVWKAGVCSFFAAAGTYDVSVKFLASSGTVTSQVRKLWVWSAPFPQ